MKFFFNIIIAFLCATGIFAQNPDNHKYILKTNIPYTSAAETDLYKKKRCKLDIYYPRGKKNYPTVVWFHGGALEGGEKYIPDALKKRGIAVVAVNYRLSPEAKNPTYIEDAAQAIAWTFNNIKKYGGSINDIYVAGHSAGGYLTLMTGFDKSYLLKYDIDANKIKGLISISGQTLTHFTIRKEQSLPIEIPMIDEYSPLKNVRKDIPPTLLVTGDKSLEMSSRYEENALLHSVLKELQAETTISELQGFDHGGVATPGCYLILEWIKKHSR